MQPDLQHPLPLQQRLPSSQRLLLPPCCPAGQGVLPLVPRRQDQHVLQLPGPPRGGMGGGALLLGSLLLLWVLLLLWARTAGCL